MMTARDEFHRLNDLPWLDRLEHHAELGSTSDYAREVAPLVPTGETLLVVADAQTAGRGRGPNRWWTGAGSLACTLMIDARQFGVRQETLPLVSLATGIAVLETIAPLVAPREAGLHWPNDVFVDGRKIAGILVEMVPDGRQLIGLGLNVNNSLAEAPPEVKAVATTLVDLTRTSHDRGALLYDILARLYTLLQTLAASPAQVARQADRWCLQHGAQLTIDCAGRRTTGRCLGIAADGALVLETVAGNATFYGGALVHGETRPG